MSVSQDEDQPASGSLAPQAPRTSLASRNFVLVCTTHLAAYVGNWIILPVLPLFLVSQGHGEGFIGLVLAAFNVSSFSTRPVFGRWVDSGRTRPALITSCGVLGVAAFGYMIPSTVSMFVVRAAHGFGWAGLNAVGTAWIAMVAPAARRAEAMGYFTMAQSLGTALAPAIGIWLLTAVNANAAFGVAGACGLLAMLAASLTTPPARPAPAAAHEVPAPASNSWITRLIDPSVLGVTITLTLVQITQPVISSFAPLYFRSIHVSGVEYYFIGQGVMSIFSRALLGQWGDRLGRSRAMVLGFSIQMLGLVILWQSRDLLPLTLGGAMYTLGVGVSQPSLYALAADRSHPARRGTAMATYTMGFQLGSGVGSLIWGSTIEWFGYGVMYACTLIPLLGAIGMAIYEGRQKPAHTY